MNTTLFDFSQIPLFEPSHFHSKDLFPPLAARDCACEVLRVFDEVELLPEDLRLIVNGEGISGSELDLLLGGHGSNFLFNAYINSCSVVLLGADRFCSSLGQMCDNLLRLTGRKSHVNCYVSPARSLGALEHSDDHDVVVVQLSGTKYWKVGPSTSSTQIVMEPGSVLFLPSGLEHSVMTRNDASLHATFGIGSTARVTLAAPGNYRKHPRPAASPTLFELSELSAQDATEICVLVDGDTCSSELQRYWTSVQAGQQLLFGQYLVGKSKDEVQMMFGEDSPFSERAQLRAKKLLIAVGCAQIA